MIALVSYNPLSKIHSVIKDNLYLDIYVADSIFNPKKAENVTAQDAHFQHLISHKEVLERIIVFVGKASSGSLEMIALFCSSFTLQQLFFVCCDHDLSEKESLLKYYGVSHGQYLVFNDNSKVLSRQCNEEQILLGVLINLVV